MLRIKFDLLGRDWHTFYAPAYFDDNHKASWYESGLGKEVADKEAETDPLKWSKETKTLLCIINRPDITFDITNVSNKNTDIILEVAKENEMILSTTKKIKFNFKEDTRIEVIEFDTKEEIVISTQEDLDREYQREYDRIEDMSEF